MCLRLESTGDLEAIKADLQAGSEDVGARPRDIEEPPGRPDQRSEEPAPALLTAIR